MIHVIRDGLGRGEVAEGSQDGIGLVAQFVEAVPPNQHGERELEEPLRRAANLGDHLVEFLMLLLGLVVLAHRRERERASNVVLKLEA